MPVNSALEVALRKTHSGFHSKFKAVSSQILSTRLWPPAPPLLPAPPSRPAPHPLTLPIPHLAPDVLREASSPRDRQLEEAVCVVWINRVSPDLPGDLCSGGRRGHRCVAVDKLPPGGPGHNLSLP